MSLNNDEDDNTIEVHIEIKSNWGHAMRLGLTEIQLYDGSNSLLQIAPSDVTVFGAEECKGTVDLLFNGKFKVGYILNTAELQWLKQDWNHKNIFETGSSS